MSRVSGVEDGRATGQVRDEREMTDGSWQRDRKRMSWSEAACMRIGREMKRER
jgi:hypothetical protein